MRDYLTLLASGLIIAITACSKPITVQPPTSPHPTNIAEGGQGAGNVIDACSLLTSKEIEAIQGAPLKEAKSSSQSQAGFTVSQCYFLLPTAADSIVLTVTQRVNISDARDPKQLWEELFHNDEEKPDSREEEERKPPEKIAGLGDEAFWAPQGFGGALYALQANTYIRISIGGPGDQASKVKKSKALAEIVLKRL